MDNGIMENYYRNMTGIGVLDFIMGVPTVFLVVKQFIEKMGDGEIDIPGISVTPGVGLFISICFGIYWVARAIQVLQKSWADHVSAMHDNESKKLKNDKIRRGELISKSGVYMSDEDLKAFGDLENRQFKEREEFMRKRGY